MAKLLTRDEVDRLIANLTRTRSLMLDDAVTMCEACHMLYNSENRTRRGICYCDYESDRSFD